jgi:hypothetical protein
MTFGRSSLPDRGERESGAFAVPPETFILRRFSCCTVRILS